MKKGFTLVELSIVLVIIGLLIGGILVGQSLIGSARINRLVSDLGQYEVATVQFYKKFKKYPGDSPHFTPPGNDDKAVSIGYGCGTGGNAAYSDSEQWQFWAHLSQAQMLSKNYAIYSPNSCAGGTQTQQSLFTGAVGPYTKVDAKIYQPLNFLSLATERAPIFASKGSASTNLYFDFYALPADTLALENKLSGQAFNGTYKQVGLVNPVGLNTCLTNVYMTGTVNCGATNAGIGSLNYYIAPM